MIYEHEKFECPICKETIGPYARGITFHARIHNLEPDEFWVIVHGFNEEPKCKCGCGLPTYFYSWKVGFLDYYKNHKPSKVRKKHSSPSGEKHWSFGKTKENNECIRIASEKRSKTLKSKYGDGTLTQWNTGFTKDTHASIKSMSEKNKNQKFHFHNIEFVMSTLNEKLNNKFILLTNKEIIASRQSVNDCYVDIQCTRCNMIRNISVYNIIRKTEQKCYNCDVFESTFEKEIKQFIEQDLQLKTTKHIVQNVEIDILVIDKNIAIECNGLYWHSSLIQTNPYQHQYKVDKCNENNIELIHIFEDEWRLKQNSIKNFLKNKLSNTNYSTNPEFKFITYDEANLFLHENDFSEINCDRTSLFIGCFYDELLYGCVEFKNLDKCIILKYVTTQYISLDLFVKFIQQKFSYKHFVFEYNQRFGNYILSENWKLINSSEIEQWFTNRVIRSKQPIDDKNIKIFGCKNLTYELVL